MRKILVFSLSVFFISCNNVSDKTVAGNKDSDSVNSRDSNSGVPAANAKPADAATIMTRKQVPVLCYHNIQQTGLPLRSSQGYDIPEEKFKSQLQALADSGYKTILPEQYYNYLVYGTTIPEKSVMLTFDDSDEDQFTIAKREMDKYGFKGVFFLMTIAIGKPRYMSKEQIRQLADEGHAVECHTWDHHRTDRYVAGDWEVQLDKPKALIEGITGKPVRYFAYPFGVWNAAGIPEIKRRGYKMAFQLSTKRDSTEPLYTARRIIVPSWSGETLLKNMKGSFK
jgi:peptidoglycan/xylan/chitin deacetylase (PgdA/CDA1 family)